MTDAPALGDAQQQAGVGRAARESRFLAGLDRVTRRAPRAELLLVAGAVLVPGGGVAIILGWRGAAATGYVFEQVPFLISGAALGVAMVFLGAFCFFAYWLTLLLAETRQQSRNLAEQADALRALQERLAPGVAVDAKRAREVRAGE